MRTERTAVPGRKEDALGSNDKIEVGGKVYMTTNTTGTHVYMLKPAQTKIKPWLGRSSTETLDDHWAKPFDTSRLSDGRIDMTGRKYHGISSLNKHFSKVIFLERNDAETTIGCWAAQITTIQGP